MGLVKQNGASSIVTREYLLRQLRNFKTDILDEAYATGDTTTYSIQKTDGTDSTTYAARYQLYQSVNGGTAEAVTGSYIDIPKDYFLQNARKVTLTANDATYGNDGTGTADTTDFDFTAARTQCSTGAGWNFEEGQNFLELTVALDGPDFTDSGVASTRKIYIELNIGTSFIAGYGIDINNGTIKITDHVATASDLPTAATWSGHKLILVDNEDAYYKWITESGVASWEKILVMHAETVDIDFDTEFDE